MTKKIFLSIFLASILVFLACLCLTIGVVYQYFTRIQQSQLREQCTLIAQGMNQSGPEYLEGLALADSRLTWLDGEGNVLYESSSASSEGMENHSDREEVREAMEKGYGESARYSATLSQKTLYAARKLADGTVLRVAVSQYTPWLLALRMMRLLVLVLLAAVGLSALLAARLSKHIVGPLNAIDLDHPLENQVYDELSPLLGRLASQRRQIRQQMEELQQKQDEFAAITGSMREGLLLLNESAKILSINPSAARLFDADPDCQGEDFLSIERSLPMQELVAQAQAGRAGEALLEREGRCYQIDANPAPGGGVVLLSVDITEKHQAEQLRREFTANVSHELKTPLQSIIGSAELLRSKLVQPQDEEGFLQRIYDEGKRLVSLVGDIIRLSQLDENANQLPPEQSDLYSLAGDVLARLEDQARAAGVSLRLLGSSAPLYTVAQLADEIIYNLTENAIKYNRPGGWVELRVRPTETGVLLEVEDNGLGIAQEHQQRVFERFYRVDKSHSRATGGTGLGLSIVKHAAQYLGAELSLRSREGEGTCIRLHFPEAKAAGEER